MFTALVAVLILMLAITGCVKKPDETMSSQIIKKITATEANALWQVNSARSDFVILDVRTPSEFNEGHLAGAVSIDYDAGNFRQEVGKLDKNLRYLVYCRTSHRSGLAVEVMKSLGFKEVYDMDGGIVEWQAAGYPVVK